MKKNTPMIHASAPGKIGWLGGYSVLEKGNTSYSSTVSARVHAHIKPAQKIRIQVPQFNIDTHATWNGKNLSLEKYSPDATFAQASIEAAFQYLEHAGKKPKPFTMKTRTDDAFNPGAGKSGLGSSAAATAAMVHGLLALHGLKDLKITHHCAQAAHAKAQGKIGSGYDVAAACFGSIEYQRFTPQTLESFPKNANLAWDYLVRPLATPKPFHLVFATFPKDSASTTSMVKTVNAWKKDHPEPYQKLIKELNDANVNALGYLEELETDFSEENLDEFKKWFNQGWTLTVEVGQKSGAPIEPQKLKKILDGAAKHGAFVAKGPGAGGLDSVAALCLSAENAGNLATFLIQKGLKVFDIHVDNQGVRTEATP